MEFRMTVRKKREGTIPLYEDDYPNVLENRAVVLGDPYAPGWRPFVQSFRHVEVKDGFLVAGPKTADEVHLPDEFFLRELFEVPTATAQDLRSFSSRFGMPTLPNIGYAFPNATWFAGEIDELKARNVPPTESSVGLEEADWALRLARLCVETWIYHLHNETDDAFAKMWSTHSFGLDPYAAESNALNNILPVINSCIRIYPRLLVFKWRDEVEGSGKDDSGGFNLPAVPLFHAIMLQLARHIDLNAEVRRCENETCHRWFYKQTGRSHAGQNRTTGLRYCSTQCSKAQSARTRRKQGRKT